jgi:uncharacterized protein
LRSAYLDASALVKLIVVEAGSDKLAAWIMDRPTLVTSRLGIIETWRAALRMPAIDRGLMARTLAPVVVIELSPSTADAAGRVAPVHLRTVDAIHLASALAIGPELDAFVTYDSRLAEAAVEAGLAVVAPG